MKNTGKNLQQVLLEQDLPIGFQDVITRLTTAAKHISNNVNRAGVVGILGEEGSVNVQGESVQKLDVFSNEKLIESLKSSPHCGVIASEENEDVVKCKSSGEYAIALDPLDGSSNIDVTAPIGTIFSVFLRSNPGKEPSSEDFLKEGKEQICSGYVIYGSSTMLVITRGNGVDGFTLDPNIGEFVLTHPDITMPDQGKIYSINEGYELFFESSVVDFLKWSKEDDKETKRPFSGRYIGSLVADFHRTLIKGGIFIYPATQKNPNGKLRLVYEAHPLALIAREASGKASNGEQDILDMKAEELHQRVPLFIGSQKTVEKALNFRGQ